MTSRTRASTRAKASGGDSTSSEQLPFAPSREERRRESEATPAAAAASVATSSTVASDAMTRSRRLHPYRRSPRFACHFDGLAAVEVQSIMQMLDGHSLLHLARCSKRLHADADSDAAWSARPLFGIMLRAYDPTIGSRLRQSLLRHLPRVYVCSGRFCKGPPVDVQAMLAIPRITQILGDEFDLSAEEWLQVFSHPCTAGLTTLHITDPSLLGALPAKLKVQLARLTRLGTIEINRSLTSGDLLAVLPTLPALTSLRFIRLDGPVEFASILPSALHACTRLTKLKLAWPDDGSRLFRSIFCNVLSPSVATFLSRLEYLVLEEFEPIVPDIPASELSAAFTAMTGLRHLVLDNLDRIDDLLPFVARIGGLVRLAIYGGHGELEHFDHSTEYTEDEFFWHSSTPTAPALQAMMQTSLVQTITLYSCDCYLNESSSDPRYAFGRLDPERFTFEC